MIERTRPAPTLAPAPSVPAADTGTRETGFRPDIEGLRAVAVLAVVLAHAGLALPGGYVGVDVFFVISGFLITRLLLAELARRDRISLAGFYARRARRIVPAASVVSLATLVAAWQWLSPLRMAAIGRDALAAALSAVNLRLAVIGTDYFASSAPPSPFQHYWSLAVEEQFYLVWPLLLVAVAALVPAARRGRALAAVLGAVALGSFWLSVTVTHASRPWAYFGGHTRAWELATGALLALAAGRLARMPNALAAQLGWAGLGAIALACLRFGDATAYPGAAVALPVLGAAAVVAGGCARPRHGAGMLLGTAPARLLGRLSYSWYLWHWPVLVIWAQAAERPLTTMEALAAVGGSLALAFATYHLVEQPARTRPALARSAWRGLALGGGLAAACAALAVVLASTAAVPAVATVAAPAFRPRAAPKGGPATVTNQVAAALRAASAVQAVPANLTPTLARAAKDLPSTGRCVADTAQRAPTYPCGSFGDPAGRRTVAVMGDSHAGMWVPALDAVARARHWRMLLFEKDGCPVADYRDFVSTKVGRVFTECNDWRAATIALIGRLRPDLVVVAGQTRSGVTSPAGMRHTVSGVAASGAKVVYLQDTPYPDRDVPDCLARHPDQVQRCALDRADRKVRLVWPQRQLEVAGARAGGAVTIDPTPWFCTERTCPPIVGDTLVYMDSSHITATYARRLAPVLGPHLAAAMARR